MNGRHVASHVITPLDVPPRVLVVFRPMADPTMRARLLAKMMQAEDPYRQDPKTPKGDTRVAKTENSGKASQKIYPGKPKVGIDARPKITNVPGRRLPIGQRPAAATMPAVRQGLLKALGPGGGADQAARPPPAGAPGTPPPSRTGTINERIGAPPPRAALPRPPLEGQVIPRVNPAIGPGAGGPQPAISGGAQGALPRGAFAQGPGAFAGGAPASSLATVPRGGALVPTTPRGPQGAPQVQGGPSGGGAGALWLALASHAIDPSPLGTGEPEEVTRLRGMGMSPNDPLQRHNLETFMSGNEFSQPESESRPMDAYQPRAQMMQGLSVSPNESPDMMHTVKRGDTLGAIIKQAYGAGIPENKLIELIAGISKANGIQNADSIQPGQQINLDAYQAGGSYDPSKWNSPAPAAPAPEDPFTMTQDDASPTAFGTRGTKRGRFSLDMGKLPHM